MFMTEFQATISLMSRYRTSISLILQNSRGFKILIVNLTYGAISV